MAAMVAAAAAAVRLSSDMKFVLSTGENHTQAATMHGVRTGQPTSSSFNWVGTTNDGAVGAATRVPAAVPERPLPLLLQAV